MGRGGRAGKVYDAVRQQRRKSDLTSRVHDRDATQDTLLHGQPHSTLCAHLRAQHGRILPASHRRRKGHHVHVHLLGSHRLPAGTRHQSAAAVVAQFSTFAKYLLFTVIVDVCCVVNTIVAINWSWRTSKTHVLSLVMRSFFFKYLARFLMIRRPSDTALPPAGTAPASTPVSRDHQQQQVRDELDMSDLHHINCRYARMSSAQRRRVLEAASGSFSHDRLRHHEYHKAVEAVRFTAAHFMNEDNFSEVRLPVSKVKCITLI